MQPSQWESRDTGRHENHVTFPSQGTIAVVVCGKVPLKDLDLSATAERCAGLRWLTLDIAVTQQLSLSRLGIKPSKTTNKTKLD